MQQITKCRIAHRQWFSWLLLPVHNCTNVHNDVQEAVHNESVLACVYGIHNPYTFIEDKYEPTPEFLATYVEQATGANNG